MALGALALLVSHGLARAQSAPTLGVSPARLTFVGADGADRLASQRVEIRNTGGGELVWHASASAAWITLSPERGLAPATLLVGIDASTLAPGSYAGRVVVEAAGATRSPQTIDISVTIAVTRPVAPPALQVTPDRVAFAAPVGQATPLTLPLRVQAERNAGVQWTARSDRPWLTLSPQAGTTPSTITLTASPAALPIGDHAATLILHAAGRGPDLRVAVTLRVGAIAGGPLGFAATRLPAAVLNVPYSHALSLHGGRPPYRVQLAGSLPPDLAIVDGVITGTPRSPGVFAFTVIASDAADPPATVTETLTLAVVIVDEQTVLAVAPARVQLSGTRERPPGPATVRVTSGGPPLTWKAVPDADWLRIEPTSGTAPGTFAVSVETRGLARGSYAATVTVTLDGAPNSPVQLPVELVVK